MRGGYIILVSLGGGLIGLYLLARQKRIKELALHLCIALGFPVLLWLATRWVRSHDDPGDRTRAMLTVYPLIGFGSTYLLWGLFIYWRARDKTWGAKARDPVPRAAIRLQGAAMLIGSLTVWILGIEHSRDENNIWVTLTFFSPITMALGLIGLLTGKRWD